MWTSNTTSCTRRSSQAGCENLTFAQTSTLQTSSPNQLVKVQEAFSATTIADGSEGWDACREKLQPLEQKRDRREAQDRAAAESSKVQAGI